MSGPPHDTWPKEGDTFAHWSDLLLATQLAALRSGYTGIGKRWEVSVPDKVSIRCHVEPCAGREDRCITTLIRARASNPEALTGTWVVDLVRTEYLDVRQHSRHVGGGIGITEGFVSAPTKHPKLRVGQLTKDWKSMHLLEAALRSEARQSGRYITAYSQRYGAAFKCSLFFACVLSDRCDFYIKFVPGEQKDGAGWICKELCTVHSCSSIAPAISRILDQSLSFWPALEIEGDYSQATNRQAWSDHTDISVSERYLGGFPVLASGQTTPPHILPPPDPSLTDKLESKRSKLSKALASLTSVRQEIINLRTKISLASILDDTDEVKKLSVGTGDLETKREKKLKKVEKKKRKIEKIKEKIKAKQMEQKKIEGTKSKSTKSKKDGKETKEKKKV